jgi:cytochrome b involved in lipid metabolism
MKKIATISLFIFIAVVSGVAIIGLIFGNSISQSITGTGSSTGAINQTGKVNPITGVAPTVKNLVLSKTELAKHNSSQSCWLLISDKIYDVTPFINSHPGGDTSILQTCGTDATAAYDTKGGRGRPHSGNANSMLADYYIGDLDQTIKTGPSKLAPTSPTGAPVTNPGPFPSMPKNSQFDD